MRNDVLAVFAKLDPQKVIALQKEFQTAAKSTSANSPEISLKRQDWHKSFSDQRAIADQSAKIALQLIDTDPEKAFKLIVQSLQGGTVSSVLFHIVQKLIGSGNRAFLNKIQMGIGQALTANLTLDPFSLSNAASLMLADKDTSLATRSLFVSFFMRSLQASSNLVKEPGIDSSYINTVFMMFVLNVRPVILQYVPEQLLMFDSVLNQVGLLASPETRSQMQAFQPETLSDPRDRLNDILNDPAPEKRDLRLVGLVSELLGKQSGDVEKNLELASDAINGFTDPEAKSTYRDRLAITRIDLFVKQKQFIEAQQLAGSISSEETRAWTLLALSSVAAKSDRVLGFELISNALRALDKASPSPHKVELALIATAMLAKSDPQRAFETFSTAASYANSSPSKVKVKQAFGFGLDAKIGEAHIKLGVSPESLGGLKIDPPLFTLALTDWFRADQIVSDIREPALRLQLKLHLAGAVLAKGPPPSQKETAPKPPAKN